MKISVIIPTYNAAKTLEACVRSVGEQGMPETEILLIDDGSTDGTTALAKQLGESMPGLRLIRQEHGGVSEARNRGLREAKGEYILFLDADDRLTDGALAALEAGIADGTDACCGRVLRGTERETFREERTVILRGPELINEALARPTDLLVIHGWLFRRRVFEIHGIYFNPALRLGEDSEMTLRYLNSCRGAALIPKAVCRYTIAPDSAIHGWKKGQTESYLRTLEAVRQTKAGQEENWPLYALTTLLLILTHDTFHPANPTGKREQLTEARRLTELPVMAEAFRKADLRRLSPGRRTVLRWLRDGRIRLARAAVLIRQKQNTGRA